MAMDVIGITVGLSWTINGLILLLLAIPLAKGQIGRNRYYGARFSQALKSDEAWQAINRYAGKQMIVWSIPIIAVGVMSFFLPLQSHVVLALVIGFVPLIFVLIPAFGAWRFAQRYENTE